MIVRQYAPCSLGRSIIRLGKQGEINALRVEFDVSAWMAMYPDATVKLMHFAPDRPQDNPVIPTLGVEGTLRVWIVGEEDTAGAGNGVIELMLIDERTGSTIKSATGYTTVLRSPSAGIEAQEPEPGYVRYDVDQSALLTDTQKAFARTNIDAIKDEKDPTVPDWAKQPRKPTYTASEVGALPSSYTPPVTSVNGMTGAVALSAQDVGARPDTWTPSASEVGADAAGTASGAVAAHNVSGAAHADLRALIDGLTSRLNALADSDDTTLDQLSEIVAYIKSNKALIDAVTTGKVSTSDIVDNLTTNASGKVLSAAQGVALKAMIDGIVIPTVLPNPQPITINGQRYDGSDAVTVTTAEIDDTLTQSGKAADAKAVGDQLSALNEASITWINVVQKYGIDPTGSTDVGIELQNIIDSVPQYTTLYFPKGRYLFNTGIVIDKILTLKGDISSVGNIPRNGFGSTEFRAIGKSNVSIITIASPAIIKDINFYSDSVVQRYNDDIPTADNLHLHYFLEKTYENVNAITVDESKNSLRSMLENIYCTGFSGVGITIPRYSSATKVLSQSCNIGIKMMVDSILSDSKVWGSGEIGIDLQTGASISNVRVEECSKYGIYISGYSSVKIYNTTIDQCGYNGIYANSLTQTTINGKITRTCQYYFPLTFDEYNNLETKINDCFSAIYAGSCSGLNIDVISSYASTWNDSLTDTDEKYILAVKNEIKTSYVHITGVPHDDYIVSKVFNVAGNVEYCCNDGHIYFVINNSIISKNGISVTSYKRKGDLLALTKGKLQVYDETSEKYRFVERYDVGQIVFETNTKDPVTWGYQKGGTWELIDTQTIGSETVYAMKKVALES